MNKHLITIAAALCCMGLTSKTMAQKERNEIDDKYKWNVADLFATDDEWTASKNQLVEKTAKISDFKGRIGRSAKDLLEYFTFQSEIGRLSTRLGVYASLVSDQDIRIADNIARQKELEQVMIDYEQLAAFARPELAAIPTETMKKYLAEEPGLAPYRMAIDRIERAKSHTLSDAEEMLLAKTSILGDVPYSAYSIFCNAEMPWPTVTLSDGTEVELSQAEFARVRASANRADRKTAYDAFWDTYKKFEGTLGELTAGNVKQNIFAAKARNYESALASALYYNNIPTDVYHALIDNVNRNLPTFHRYLQLKKRLMGLDTLEYYDLYAPAVADVELNYTYEEAQELVLEAVKPLGDEYVSVVKRAFDERWIDVYPNKGKASGAYSSGSVYDAHPYILMNYDDRLENVGTLIHELGHTMHSYMSNKTQPYPTARYAIYVAEVASTFNEALLDDLMREKITDRNQKISLLMNILDGFKGTLFRQTQFAEFELAMHEAAEKGIPLTGKALSQMYGEIVRKYYGHDKGVCNVDEKIDIEWAFIPHFYMDFYVYQYSTSFVASQALSEMVLSGDKEATRRYLDFISAGGSKYPIDLLREAGVDMTKSEPFDKAIEKMNRLMDEIEKLLLTQIGH